MRRRVATLGFRATRRAHYSAAVRDVYDSAPFYAPGPYESWLSSACVHRFDLEASHSLADVGGGSGSFASRLKKEVGARWLTVVEPSAAMLEGAASDPAVDAAECADALVWANGALKSADDAAPVRYDRLLLKEVVHHLDPPERQRVFALLRTRRLANDGRLLIVTRPQHGIDYPLWAAAREVWADNQPGESELIDDLRAAGFAHVECHLHAYPHAVRTDEWCRLVRGRFWSTFSHFTDRELEAGCAEIRAHAESSQAGDGQELRFEDRLLLIVARAAEPESAVFAASRDGNDSAGYIHLNAAGASPMPREAFEAMSAHLELERAVGAYAAAARRPHGARGALAALLRCDASEIALADSAQSAWARAFYSLRFESDDRILCFSPEYAGNAVAFLQVAGRSGARIEVLPARHDGVIDMGSLESALSARRAGRTLVALTHVQTNLSIVQPAEAVGALCRRHGAVFLLDACQSIGQMPVDVRAIDCDFACGCGRKWLRGPRGSGFLYVRSEAMHKATQPGNETLYGEPPLIDHSGAVWSAPDSYTLLPDARRFEMWEADEAARHGLVRRPRLSERSARSLCCVTLTGWLAVVMPQAAAVDLCRRIGPEKIYARASTLAQRLRAGLRAIDGCILRDAPPSFDEQVARSIGADRCAIVTFELESTHGLTSTSLRDALDARGIGVSVSSSYHSFDPLERARPPAVRLSPTYFCTEDEVDAVLDAIAQELTHHRGKLGERASGVES